MRVLRISDRLPAPCTYPHAVSSEYMLRHPANAAAASAMCFDLFPPIEWELLLPRGMCSAFSRYRGSMTNSGR